MNAALAALSRSVLPLSVVAAMLLPQRALNAADMPLQPGTTVHLASVEEGVAVLVGRDHYVTGLSPFDRQARLKTDREVSEAEYLEFVSGQVLPWSDRESRKMAMVVESIGKKLTGWHLPLPATISIIKTTGREEAQAAYCRGANVALPSGVVGRRADRLEATLVHELFHVLSNQNPELRKKLYASLGFKPCMEVSLPASLESRKLSNPDAPDHDYYIEVTQAGQPIDLVPVLFANREHYDTQLGGEFFQYLTFRLMQVERQGDDWRPALANGEPVLLAAEDVPGYAEQIGRNTEYIIHPEEVLADNFVLLVNRQKEVPTPRILEAMENIFQPAPAPETER